MFDELKGNEKVKNLLRRLIASQRIPNSLLFAGPEGIGKKRFALEIARAVICADSAEDACERCGPCLRSTHLNHPDSEKKDDFQSVIPTGHPDLSFVLAYNRNILVDAIRSLEVEANYLPFEAPGRFFIIDDAHKMNDAAANALLKTLEEPPATTHIFLITSKPDALLPTIRSRCQTVRFSPLSSAEIAVHLSKENIHKGKEAELVARLANGSMARALELDLDSFFRQRTMMMRVLEATTSRPSRLELIKLADEINDTKNKEHFEDFLGILESLARDAWLLAQRKTRDKLINVDIAEELDAIAGRTNPRIFVEWIEKTDKLRDSLRVNINKKIALNALFMEMSS